MNIPNDNLESLLNHFDNISSPYSEHTVSGAIKNIEKTDDNSFFIDAEVVAFNFSEKGGAQNGWGTYFGPLMTFQGEDGKYYESPSIKSLTPEIISYWEKRSSEVKHPILKARYSGLVWDFKKKVCSEKADYKFALTAIDSLLLIANDDLYEYDIFVITKLERALELSLKLKNEERIKATKKAFFDFEEKLASDDKPGTWGFVYDSLIREHQIADQDEERLIIADLESRHRRIKNEKDVTPTAIEGTALRLAEYYKLKQKKDDLIRILKDFEEFFTRRDEGSALRTVFSLEQVYEVYIQYEFFKDAERVSKKIDEISPNTVEEMSKISISQDIDQQEVTDLINKIVTDDIDEASSNIVGYFTPKKSHIENQIKDLSKKAPLSFIAKKSIISNSGRKIAELDSLFDEEGQNGADDRIVDQISQNLSFESFFLEQALEKFVNKFNLNPKDFFDELKKSPAFVDSRKDLIELGLENYFEKNYMICCHLLIPQLEHAFRTVLKLSGGFELKTKRSKYGGYEVKTLGTILSEEYILNVFGEDSILYFRTLLIDQRGWNIRNDICHGLIGSERLDRFFADRILHLFLCLGRIRLKVT